MVLYSQLRQPDAQSPHCPPVAVEPLAGRDLLRDDTAAAVPENQQPSYPYITAGWVAHRGCSQMPTAESCDFAGVMTSGRCRRGCASWPALCPAPALWVLFEITTETGVSAQPRSSSSNRVGNGSGGSSSGGVENWKQSCHHQCCALVAQLAAWTAAANTAI